MGQSSLEEWTPTYLPLSLFKQSLGGVSRAINVPVGTDVHWFTSVLMVRDGFNDCLYSRMSPNFLTALSGDVTTNIVGNSDVTATTVNFVGAKTAAGFPIWAIPVSLETTF